MTEPPDKSRNAEQQQKVYTIYEYHQQDVFPYRVIVQLADDNKGELRINKLTLGRLVSKQNDYKNSIYNMRALGRNKVLVFLKDYQTANKLQSDPMLKNNNYKAYIPRSFVSVSGVVAGVPTDMDLEEIKENISSNFPILAINRLHRYEAGNKIPTNRISIVFRASKLPTEVRLFCCINSVRPFINKPVLCLNCLRYNHKTESCRSKKRCENCSLQHEGLETGQCQNRSKCLYCRNNDEHRTTDQNCPERIRQKNIKSIMAKTTLTYMEAREQNPTFTQNRYEILENADEFPTIPESYAKMTSGVYKPVNAHQYKPQKAKRPIEQVNIAEQVTVFADKKKKKDDGEEQRNGVALFNKYRVDDFEKFVQKFELQQKHKDQQQQIGNDGDGNTASTSGAVIASQQVPMVQRKNRSRDRSKQGSERYDWSMDVNDKM